MRLARFFMRDANGGLPFKKRIRCKRHPYLSLKQWLGYIRNARFVVTDAFHGTVFSIIFNRNFFSEISEYRKDTGSRITNILDLFSLQDRPLDQSKEQELLMAASIDYEQINKKIMKERVAAEQHFRRRLGPSDITEVQ